jgi:hypothetical protein
MICGHHQLMKTALSLVAFACTVAVAPALAQDVRVTVSGEVAPGVYGRVDIGSGPRPRLVNAQPVVVVRQARAPGPIYLHVPPGHARNWSKHCSKYNACSRPVYFVRSAEYEPGYKHPGKGASKAAGKGK